MWSQAKQLDGTRNHGVCDESKCVSRGLSDHHGGSFTCYGDDGTHYPKMCADGYLPTIVDDEFPFFATGLEGTELQYFTCCPPTDHVSLDEEMDVNRHCSDPISTPIIFDETINTVCDDHGSQKYPRRMKTSIEKTYSYEKVKSESKTDSFLCCDTTLAFEDDENDDDMLTTNSTSTTTNFLDDSECVPYKNEYYDPAKIQNQIGEISTIKCSFPDGSFQFPVPIGDGTYQDVASTGQYQCCRSNHGPSLPLFVQDSEFKITVYLPLVLCCIAAVVSAIVFLATLIPLLVQLANGTYQRSLRSRRQEPTYRTFNLYLVFLALPDLLICLYYIWDLGSIFNPKTYDGFLSLEEASESSRMLNLAATSAYQFSQHWMNAIVSYQVFNLLRSSEQGRRIGQPSLRRLCLQAGIVYTAAIAEFALTMYIRGVICAAYKNGDTKKGSLLFSIIGLWDIGTKWLPMIYVFRVLFVVCRRGYLPYRNGTTVRDQGLRELSFYFFRIAVPFYVPYILITVFFMLYIKGKLAWGLMLQFSTGAVIAIIKFCVILTKPDVRKYIVDLVTFSYCFGGCSRGKNGSTEEDDELSDNGEEENELPIKDNESKALDQSRSTNRTVPEDFDSDTCSIHFESFRLHNKKSPDLSAAVIPEEVSFSSNGESGSDSNPDFATGGDNLSDDADETETEFDIDENELLHTDVDDGHDYKTDIESGRPITVLSSGEIVSVDAANRFFEK